MDTQEAKNLVLNVRQAAGDTQAEFAQRLGVGLRSLKRYENENRLPENQAVMRTLRTLAKKYGIAAE